MVRQKYIQAKAYGKVMFVRFLAWGEKHPFLKDLIYWVIAMLIMAVALLNVIDVIWRLLY